MKDPTCIINAFDFLQSNVAKSVTRSLVDAGADIVGINCHLDPLTCVRTVKLMKEGLEKAGLKAHLMVQPLGFHTPECNVGGYLSLPEFPFGQCFPVVLPASSNRSVF